MPPFTVWGVKPGASRVLQIQVKLGLQSKTLSQSQSVVVKERRRKGRREGMREQEKKAGGEEEEERREKESKIILCGHKGRLPFSLMGIP